MIRMFRKFCLSSLFCACLLCTLQAAETDKTQKNDEEEQQDELVISSDRMEMQLDGKTVELTGNVRIEDSAMSLTALKMMVYLTEAEKEDDKAKPKEGEAVKEDKAPKEGEKKKDKDAANDEVHSNMKLQRIEADGEVVLRKLDGTESAMGDHAVYDVKDDTIIMTGNCSILQGKNTMLGDKVVYDRKKAKINIQKPRLTIQIDRKGGKNSGALGNIFSEKDEKDSKDDKKSDDKKSDDKPKEGKNIEEKPKEDKNAEEKPKEVKSVEDKPKEDKNAEVKPNEVNNIEDKPKEDKNVEVKPKEDKKEKRGFWSW